MKIIINADDYGKDAVVNSSIEQALKNGYISSATILANTRFWDDIHRTINECPYASFGIHLNLTEGQAMTRSEILRKYDIVDDNNNFTRKIREVRFLNEDLRLALYQELDCQFHKLCIVEGIRISHVDSHHHIHHQYPLIEIIANLMSKYGINRIRTRSELPQSSIKSLCKGILRLIVSKSLWKVCLGVARFFPSLSKLVYLIEASLWLKLCHKSFKCTDYFSSYERFFDICKNLNSIYNGKTIELMCHPGHKHYQYEFDLICGLALQKTMADIKIISFNKLH